jgi:hypothetical protein
MAEEKTAAMIIGVRCGSERMNTIADFPNQMASPLNISMANNRLAGITDLGMRCSE